MKFSGNSTQNMPKLPVAGVLGGAFRHGSTLRQAQWSPAHQPSSMTTNTRN
jgi:hypothetical protein